MLIINIRTLQDLNCSVLLQSQHKLVEYANWGHA